MVQEKKIVRRECWPVILPPILGGLWFSGTQTLPTRLLRFLIFLLFAFLN